MMLPLIEDYTLIPLLQSSVSLNRENPIVRIPAKSFSSQNFSLRKLVAAMTSTHDIIVKPSESTSFCAWELQDGKKVFSSQEVTDYETYSSHHPGGNVRDSWDNIIKNIVGSPVFHHHQHAQSYENVVRWSSLVLRQEYFSRIRRVVVASSHGIRIEHAKNTIDFPITHDKRTLISLMNMGESFIVRYEGTISTQKTLSDIKHLFSI